MQCIIIHIWRCIMRTNVVLNDELVNEAFRYARVSTKRELLEVVLKEFVDHHKRMDIREFKHQITIDSNYDYKKLRDRG